MKIFYASDLHLEFQPVRGMTIVDYCCNDKTKESTVCILAGDIGMIKNHTTIKENHLLTQLKKFCDHFKYVIYVHGNHEYYNHSIAEGQKDFKKRTASKLPNLYWLNDQVVEIEGQRFLGSTLWAQKSDDYIHGHWLNYVTINCFDQIKDLIQSMDWRNAYAESFLRENLRKDDILITHFPTTRLTIDPRFRTSNTLWYYTNKFEELIFERKPKLCISGHSHHSFDEIINDVRFVGNPFGYFRHEENSEFSHEIVIDI